MPGLSDVEFFLTTYVKESKRVAARDALHRLLNGHGNFDHFLNVYVRPHVQDYASVFLREVLRNQEAERSTLFEAFEEEYESESEAEVVEIEEVEGVVDDELELDEFDA